MNGKSTFLAQAAVVLLMTVGLLFTLGATAQGWLYQVVSYSGAPAVDAKLAALAEDGAAWNVIAVGSSEVRWGFSPEDFDNGVMSVYPEFNASSFNFGLDGFPPGLVYPVLKHSDAIPEDLPVKVLLIGINLAEGVSIVERKYSPGVCGDLQRPIFTSAFARDNDLTLICTERKDRTFFPSLARALPLAADRRELRDFLLGRKPRPLTDNVFPNGFYAHAPAAAEANYYANFEADLPDMRENEPGRFATLDPAVWENATAPGGFFDTFSALARENGWYPIFFALPTNPIFFDVFGKEDVYETNSALLQDWAETREASFIDLGIRRDFDRELDYADFRHLSADGARKYSRLLGAAVADDLASTGSAERLTKDTAK